MIKKSPRACQIFCNASAAFFRYDCIAYLPTDSVPSVKIGVEELDRHRGGYVKIIFGSHYIAEEVYTVVGKYFDTTNN